MTDTTRPKNKGLVSVALISTLLSGSLVSESVFAELLGVTATSPRITYNNTGMVNYDEKTDIFSVDATALVYINGGGGAACPPYGTTCMVQAESANGTQDVTIRIEVDDTGSLVGGVPGDDLIVTGAVDVDGDSIIDFDGVLLTGEILAFGYMDSGGPTDSYDFRFEITGGLLHPTPFAGPDVGATLTAENSNFTGSFQTNITGGAKGAVFPLPLPLGCRFTGGGVDTDGNWDHTLEDGEMIRNGAGNLPAGIDRYQMGGQAGANTALPPQPAGEWTHHQQRGPSGSFTFHGGTASAPAGTEIDEIRCSDPGFCRQARPAPAKQLDFDGIGTFKSIGKGPKTPIWEISDSDANVTAEGKGNKDFDGTFHWFEVNIDDLGEPGSDNTGQHDLMICPGRGFGEKSDGPFVPDPVNNPNMTDILPNTPLASCDCADFYRITIYQGVDAADVEYDVDGNIDPASLDRTTVIYEAFGYIDGGNLQIHPLTGFDQ